MPQDLADIRLVNIGSRNGLVLSGNKPLPEAMLTQICVAKYQITQLLVTLKFLYKSVSYVLYHNEDRI